MLLFMLVLLAGCKDSEDGAEKDAGAGELGTQDNLEETKKMNEQGNSAGGGQQSKTEQQGLQELPEQDNDFAGKQQQNEGKEEGQKKSRPEGWELEFASEDWGLSFGEPGTQPVGNASAEDLAWYDAYFMGSDEEKVIYLTFDCGYENGNTEPILDALKKHNAQATFFVVGHFLESAPDVVKRMVEDGHTVGNHTYHHPDMSKISDTDSFSKEMNDVAALFREVTGTEMAMYYRPPQGKYSTANLQMAKDMGYSTFFWSLAYVDWNQDDQPSHEEALKKLTERIHPGAIVLLHSTSKTNGEIMDEILTKWEEMGYTFRTLADFVGEKDQGTPNKI